MIGSGESEHNSNEFTSILELGIRQWRINTALIYDAVMLLAQRLKGLGFDFLDIQYDQEIDCFDTRSKSGKGNTIENSIKAVRRQHRAQAHTQTPSFIL